MTTYVARLEAENADLRDRLAYLEGYVFGEALSFPPEWRLSLCERRVLSAIVALPVASTAACLTALYHDREGNEPQAENVRVVVCRLRRKLRPLGIEITTAVETGYAIAEPKRSELRRRLRQNRALVEAEARKAAGQ